MNNKLTLAGLSLLLVCFTAIYGCSSSSEDDSDNTQKANTISFIINLDGAQQIPQPVQTAATGTATIQINQDSLEIGGQLTVKNISSTVTAAHIHQGVAGTNSPPLIAFEKSDTNANMWNIPSGNILTFDQYESLLNGGMYINVHTADHTGGEVRGQIPGQNTEVIRTQLSGDNEVPPVNTIGDGIAYITLNKDSADLIAVVHVNNIVVTQGHIHQAYAGTNSAAAITLEQNINDTFIWEANTTLSNTQLDALMRGEMYINIHTANNTGGDIRGQIAPSAIKVIRTTLDGNQQVPDPVSTNGNGVAYATLNANSGDLIANARVENLSGDATAAHIHQAAAGENANVAVPLTQNDSDTNLWQADTTLSIAQQQALLNGDMYFNVHSSAFPDGELRGQVLEPGFTFIQNTVFNTSCVSCHSGADASGGLSLENNNAFDQLINKASNQDSNIERVTPANAGNSYLIHKLEGTAATGSQMPPNGNPLNQVVIDNIRQWIDAGAEPN